MYKGHNQSDVVSASLICAFGISLLIVGCALNAKALAEAQDREPTTSASEPRIEVGVPVSLPVDGVVRQLKVSSAPDNPDNILVCTFENDVEHSRETSAAYGSFDGGSSWTMTLRDASSLWVSETSCTLGQRGRAYFVASASNTTRGGMGHQEGTTDVFRSLDGGLTWMGPRKYPFMDWTSLALGQPDGEGNQKVFLFANHLATGFGDFGEGAWVDGSPILAISEGNLRFGMPRVPDDGEGLVAAFPISSLSTEDGRVLSLVERVRGGSAIPDAIINAWDGRTYKAIGKIELPSQLGSPSFLSGQMAMDRSRKFPGRLYVAFPAIEGDRNTLQLGISDDNGKSWSVHTMLRGDVAGEAQRQSVFAAVAVNRDGVVGVEWLPPGGCPRFGISVDGGYSLADTIELSNCRVQKEREMLPSAVKAHLWTLNADLFHEDRNDTGPGFSTFVQGTTSLDFHMVADAAGGFHMFWVEMKEDGSLQLLTTRAVVRDRTVGPQLKRLDLSATKNISKSTVINVLRNTFDPMTATFSLDLTVGSVDEPTPFPTHLEVYTDHSECGNVTYLNPFGQSLNGHAVFRIGNPQPRVQLLPGQQTVPVHVDVRVPGCENLDGSLLDAGRKFRTPGKPLFSPLSVRFHVLSEDQVQGGAHPN